MHHPMNRSLLLNFFAIAGLSFVSGIHAADKPDEFAGQPPIPALTAAEELKKFELPPGYRLELVVGEPDIKEPVVAVFDGNGRMYVAEMRSYMQDIDGQNEITPTGRVSVHWSSKGDGVFDKHAVFADKLILPRMVLPLSDGGV